MMVYLRHFWEILRTSYWFIPGSMMLLAAGLSFLILKIDRSIHMDWPQILKWIYANDAEGAQTLLSTVAGSMITVASVVFSITIVVLSLASSQFGPRLLRSFMQDRGNQVVLGTFTATFLYCLLVLRYIVGTQDQLFVPHLSVAFGLLLAITSLFVLIYYIHHTAASIQAENVINKVNSEFNNTINRLFPDMIDDNSSDLSLPQGPDMPLINFEKHASSIPVVRSGYIQAIDEQRLIRVAQQNDIVIYVGHRTGRYLIAGTTLAQAWPCEKLEQELIEAINKSFILGLQPTPERDVEFAVRQLVEIAVRALSPGVNDPFTAITCIDYLSTGLSILTARRFPAPYYYDEEHRLRLITHAVTFSDIADRAFNQLRQYGGSSTAVAIRLLENIAMMAPLARREEDRRALSLHATMILEECLRHIHEQRDRDDVHARYQAITGLSPRHVL